MSVELLYWTLYVTAFLLGLCIFENVHLRRKLKNTLDQDWFELMKMKPGTHITVESATRNGWIGKLQVTYEGSIVSEVIEMITGEDGYVVMHKVDEKGDLIFNEEEDEFETVTLHGNVQVAIIE